MHTDTWYELAVRELAEMTDPAREKLADLEATVEGLELGCLADPSYKEPRAEAEPPAEGAVPPPAPHETRRAA
jgi:hypothetical protein